MRQTEKYCSSSINIRLIIILLQLMYGATVYSDTKANAQGVIIVQDKMNVAGIM